MIGKMFCILFILAFFQPAYGASPDYSQDLPKWIDLLKKGNDREKQVALHSLWFLEYPQYRRDSRVFDPILEALKDQNPTLREAAAASLKSFGGCCRDPKIVLSLIEALNDDNSGVRAEAAVALGYFRDNRATPPLIPKLKDPSPWVRLNAIFSLGELKAIEAMGPLLELLQDPSDWRNKLWQQEVLIAIRKIGKPGPQGISILRDRFTDEYLKVEIIKTFGALQVFEARDLLTEAAQDSDDRVRKLSIEAFAQWCLAWAAVKGRPSPEMKDIGEYGEAILTRSLRDPLPEIRGQSAEILGKLQDNRAVEPLMEACRDRNEMVREKAFAALRNFREERIFDTAIDFISANPGLSHSGASETFKAVAQMTSKGRIYVYNQDGRHYRGNIPPEQRERQGKVPYRELMIHPVAVDKLIRALDTSDARTQPLFLGLLGNFDDSRIEGYSLNFLQSPSPSLRRRAASLLETSGSERAVPELIAALHDPDKEVQIQAVESLGYLGDPRALEPLIAKLLKELDKDMQIQAIKSLKYLGDPRSLEPLMAKLKDRDARVREEAVRSLTHFKDGRILDLAVGLLKDKSSPVRSQAVIYIKKNPDQRAVEPLISLLGDPDEFVATRSAEALGIIKDKRAVEPLIQALNGQFSRRRGLNYGKELRERAAIALGTIGDPKAVPSLVSALDDPHVQVSAIFALGEIKNERAVSALIRFIGDKDVMTRQVAVSALRKIGSPSAMEAIKGIPERKFPSVVATPTPARPVPPEELKRMQLPHPLPPDAYPLGVEMGLRRHLNEPEPSGQPPKEKVAPVEVPPLPTLEYPVKKEPLKTIPIQPFTAQLKSENPKIRREAADSLGDTRNPEATGYLVPLLKDRDAYVRQAVARALGKLRDSKATPFLIESLRDEDTYVRPDSVWALGEIRDDRAISPLASLMVAGEWEISEKSFQALRKYSDPQARPIMVKTLIEGAQKQNSRAESFLRQLISLEGKEVVLRYMQDPGGNDQKTVRSYINYMELRMKEVSPIAQQALREHRDRSLVNAELSAYIRKEKDSYTAVEFLAQLQGPQAAPLWIEVLKNRRAYSNTTVVAAIEAVKDLSDQKAASGLLLEILVNPKESAPAREHAAKALGKLRYAQAVPPMVHMLTNKKEEKQARNGIVIALGDLRDPAAVSPLIDILLDQKEDIWFRVGAAYSLGHIRDERAIGPLQQALQDPSDDVRNAAQKALDEIKNPRS